MQTEFERANAAIRGMTEEQKIAWMAGWAFGIRETNARWQDALAAGTREFPPLPTEQVQA